MVLHTERLVFKGLLAKRSILCSFFWKSHRPYINIKSYSKFYLFFDAKKTFRCQFLIGEKPTRLKSKFTFILNCLLTGGK